MNRTVPLFVAATLLMVVTLLATTPPAAAARTLMTTQATQGPWCGQSCAKCGSTKSILGKNCNFCCLDTGIPGLDELQEANANAADAVNDVVGSAASNVKSAGANAASAVKSAVRTVVPSVDIKPRYVNTDKSAASDEAGGVGEDGASDNTGPAAERDAPPEPTTKLYIEPQWNGGVLGWCWGWNKECGEAAAAKFCQAKGHKGVASVGPRKDAPMGQSVEVPDGGWMGPKCTTNALFPCRAFTTITCSL